jgi:hypothetical protein
VKSITMLVSALVFYAVAPISADAKTDRSTSKCEQRCHDYHCYGGADLMYCHWACQEKCKWEEHTESGDYSKKK